MAHGMRYAAAVCCWLSNEVIDRWVELLWNMQIFTAEILLKRRKEDITKH